jgi:alginate O-acetyltransferase complex protein AlgJ
LLELLISGMIGFIIYSFQVKCTTSETTIEVLVKVLRNDEYHFFYSNNTPYSQDRLLTISVKKSDWFQSVKFEIPTDSFLTNFRLDFGNHIGEIVVKQIKMSSTGYEYIWDSKGIIKDFNAGEDVNKLFLRDSNIVIKSIGDDPFIYLNRNIKKEYTQLVASSKFNQFFWPKLVSLTSFIILFICIRISNYSDKWYTFILDSNRLILLAFTLTISLPLINFYFGIIPEGMNYENRELYPKPIFNIKDIRNFPGQYTSFFNDHFGFRSTMIKLNSYFKIKLLRTSPNKKIILGKNNWLFLTDKEDLTLAAEPLFSEEELDAIEKSVEQRSIHLKKIGIDYYILIAPDKAMIYPEYLPEAYKKRKVNARLDQLINRLVSNKNIKIIDVRDVLISAKTERELYYSADTHWNVYAAMLAYDKLMKIIREDHPDFTSINTSNYDFILKEEIGGDLSDHFNTPELFEKKLWLIRQKNSTDQFKLPYPEITKKIHYVNPDNVGHKKLFMYHDSFGLFILEPASRDFHESQFYWSHDYYQADIDEYKPNIVVQEIVSRFIYKLK